MLSVGRLLLLRRLSILNRRLSVETHSLPALARCYSHSFSFYVSYPFRSIPISLRPFDVGRWALSVGRLLSNSLARQLPRAKSSILFHSSALSWSFSAATFSSRCASDDVPGIGNMTSDFCSNQASASCTTLTLRRFASASNALPALLNERLPLPPIGAHGMNPIFSFSQ